MVLRSVFSCRFNNRGVPILGVIADSSNGAVTSHRYSTFTIFIGGTMLKHSGGIMVRLLKYPDRLVNNSDDPQKSRAMIKLRFLLICLTQGEGVFPCACQREPSFVIVVFDIRTKRIEFCLLHLVEALDPAHDSFFEPFILSF